MLVIVAQYAGAQKRLSDFLRLDVAEDVVVELLWTFEELAFVIGEPCAGGDLRLKQAERTYEVRDLEEPVFARFDGLCKFNRTWKRRRSNPAEGDQAPPFKVSR